MVSVMATLNYLKDGNTVLFPEHPQAFLLDLLRIT